MPPAATVPGHCWARVRVPAHESGLGVGGAGSGKAWAGPTTINGPRARIAAAVVRIVLVMAMTLGTPRPADVRATSGSADAGIAADHDVSAGPLCQHRRVSSTVLVVDDHAWFRTAV